MAESSHSSEDHTTAQKKRTRGPTLCKNMKKAAKQMNIIEFDDKHRPIGPGTSNFKHYVGSLARIHVDINISDWHKVDQGLKDMMWEEIKREFNILDDRPKSRVLRVAGMRWKDFKTRLVHNFITHVHPKYTSPTQLYDFLTEEQWELFKNERQTESFKEKSKKARDSQMRNKHPHYLGSAGYAGMKPQWLVSDPLSSSSSCDLISSSIVSEDRSLDWVRARSKKKEDGTYYIPNEKTRGVFDKIVEKAEEATQGTFVSSRQHDILSEALGKDDHYGRVRGYGVYVTTRDVFGRPDDYLRRSCGVVSVDDIKDIIRKEMEDSITERVRHQTMSEMQSKFDSMQSAYNSMQSKYDAIIQRLGLNVDVEPEVTAQPRPPTRSSCHSVNPDPFDGLQKPIPCRLAVSVDGDKQVVATGMVYPSGPETVVHHQPLLLDHVKVSVDYVIDGAEAFYIPVPSQHHTTVGEAIGSFVQWPKELVFFGEEEAPKKIEKKSIEGKRPQSFEMSSTQRPAIVDDETLQRLGDKCKMLNTLVLQLPVGDDFYQVPVDASIFNCTFEDGIFVTVGDITDLLSMQWLDTSILQIFALYLHELCQDYGIESIGFMSPSHIASVSVRTNANAVVNYMDETMRAMQTKKFILAPYFQESHWMLLVISPQKNTVYLLDSASTSKRDLDIKPLLNTAFKLYWTQGGTRTRTNTTWLKIKCPQQPGGSECGYYVMRNMYEITTEHFQRPSLENAFKEYYSTEEIAEIQNLWAKYFVDRVSMILMKKMVLLG